jgi:hypothetical protein
LNSTVSKLARQPGDTVVCFTALVACHSSPIGLDGTAMDGPLFQKVLPKILGKFDLLLQWMQCTCDVLLSTGILSEEEKIIRPCRATHAASSVLENAGDAWWCQYAGFYIQPIIAEVCQWADFRPSDGTGMTLAHELAAFLCANITGGFMMVFLFKLDEHFVPAQGLVMNHENITGIWETFIGGCQRRGHLGVIQGLAQVGAAVVCGLIFANHLGHVSTDVFLEKLFSRASIAYPDWSDRVGLTAHGGWQYDVAMRGTKQMKQMWAAVGSKLASGHGNDIHCLLNTMLDRVPQGTLAMEASSAMMPCSGGQHPSTSGYVPQCASGYAPPPPPPPRVTASNHQPPAPSNPHEVLNLHNPALYRLHFKCCQCRGPNSEWLSREDNGGTVYEEAVQLGWRKVGGTWAKQKCPDCSSAGR